MKRTLILAIALVALSSNLSLAQAPAPTTLGRVRVSRAVLADGQPLGAAAYEVRLTGAEPARAAGMSLHAEQWVEFLSQGVVVGREVATVISDRDMRAIAESPRPASNSSRTDLLKGGDYLRVWISRNGTHYLINMPLAGRRS